MEKAKRNGDAFIKKLVRSVEFAEEHIDEDFSLTQMAREACLSEYHYHRIFLSMTGMTPGLYIRKRRLTRAVHDLLYGATPVIQIAVGAGYDTQESFTRAFKAMFGVAPATLRKKPRDLSCAFQPVLTQEIIGHLSGGGITLEPEFRRGGGFTVAGPGGDFVVGDTPGINALWKVFVEQLENEGLVPEITYGICQSASPETLPQKSLHYMAGYQIDPKCDPPPGMEKIYVPEGEYAVFLHRGHISDFDATVRYIWQCWIPRSGCELADTPDFELYDDRFNPDSLEGEVEIWAPLKSSK